MRKWAPGTLPRRTPIVVVGVVVAHTLDYVAVFSDPARRGSDLKATGHGYWPLAAATAALAAVVALALAVAGGARRSHRRPRPTPAASFAADFGCLAVAQMVVFTIVETAERVAAGAPVAGLWGHPEFILGLLLQVIVAAASLAALWAVESLTAEVVGTGGRTRRRPPTALALPMPAAVAVAGSGPSRTPARPRGPPSPACA